MSKLGFLSLSEFLNLLLKSVIGIIMLSVSVMIIFSTLYFFAWSVEKLIDWKV